MLIPIENMQAAWRERGLQSPWFLCQSVVSTQDELRRRIGSDLPEGTVLIADSQTGGRGRFGRHWLSPPGGLFLSVLLRPDRPAEEASRWTIAAGLASFDAIATGGTVPCRMKWPNDLWTANGKLAGTLVEGKTRNARWLEAVIGWGVNVIRTPEHPALQTEIATLSDHTGQETGERALAGLAASFVFHLLTYHARLQTGAWSSVRDLWESRDNLYQDRRIRTREGLGTACGLDDRGRLRVRLETGILIVLDDGDAVRVVE